MNIDFEKIINNIKSDYFHNLTIETILFDSLYPILFTCTDNEDVYLVICYNYNSKYIGWIISKTSYSNLIELLENKITLKDAFLNTSKNKFIINYYNKDNIEINIVDKNNYQLKLCLPKNEFIETEENEFKDEIDLFKIKLKK